MYYVIVHEFSHLIVPNHSKDFYSVVSEFCPNYKEIKKELNNIVIR
ncbi:MAG: M48 family metallopeptidase [Ruminococcus sp.]